MSKGSKARPYSVSFDEYDSNFNRIFRQERPVEILEDSAVPLDETMPLVTQTNKEILSETPQ